MFTDIMLTFAAIVVGIVIGTVWIVAAIAGNPVLVLLAFAASLALLVVHVRDGKESS